MSGCQDKVCKCLSTVFIILTGMVQKVFKGLQSMNLSYAH